MRFAGVAAAVVLFAGCGGSARSPDAGTGGTFDRHLRQDGLVLSHASAVLRPPPSKSMQLWAAELRAAQPRMHAAALDLAAVNAPADAQADTRAILKGFQFTDGLIARLARDVGHRNQRAILRDASSLRPSRSDGVFGPFRSAVRDLQKKGYEVGVLGR